MKLLGLTLLLLSSCAARSLKNQNSKMPSTVSGISIPNAHQVGKSELVFRGQRPVSTAQATELKKAGIDRILIFRNETPSESTYKDELDFLAAAGFSPTQTTIIPFQWKGINDQEKACVQTVQALKIIHDAETQKQKIFFHCTFGEDRTGFLAATYRQLTESETPENLFKTEMCRWGYANGSRDKPPYIVDLIRRNINPMYSRLSFLIHKRLLTWNHLDEHACILSAENKTAAAEFQIQLESKTSNLSCQPN